MRGKRSKQYRKLMQQYCLTFGFREPYQVLGAFKMTKISFILAILILTFTVDAQMIQDADRFKMDLTGSLERVLHGKVKPCMRIPKSPALKNSRYSWLINTHRCASNHSMLHTPPLHIAIYSPATKRLSYCYR